MNIIVIIDLRREKNKGLVNECSGESRSSPFIKINGRCNLERDRHKK